MDTKILQHPAIKRSFLLSIAAFVVVLSCGFGLLAQADISGSGILKARGDGIVIVSGEGEVVLSGQGILLVNENADVAIVKGGGSKLDLAEGGSLYLEFNGKAQIDGEAVEIAFCGTNIFFRVRGKGKVLLIGAGGYRIGQQVGHWAPDQGTEIIINDSEEEDDDE